MKPAIQLISVFEKAQEENGKEYHIGTLNPTEFKKAKGEIPIILMKGALLPPSLIGNHPQAQENLYMFVQTDSNNEE